jgi:hypothetical protein
VARVDLDFDARQMERLGRDLADVPGGLRRAKNSAVRKTTTEARRVALRRAAKNLKVAQKKIKRQVTKRTSANRGEVEGRVRVDGWRVPLGYLAPRQVRLGVSYNAAKGGRRTARHAFMSEALGGGEHVFRRDGFEAGGGLEADLMPRLPIIKLHTASPAQAAEHDGPLARDLREHLPEHLRENVDRAATRVLRRATRGGG